MTTYYKLDKYDIFRLINSKIQEVSKGKNFTLMELLDDLWQELDPYTRREAAKLFKINVLTREVTSVWLERKKRKNSWVYHKL